MEESGEEEGSEEVIEGGSNQIEEESKVMADGGPEEPKINANKKGRKMTLKKRSLKKMMV